jgi:hypothetical protein
MSWILGFAVAATPAASRAETANRPPATIEYALDSGKHDGGGKEAKVAFTSKVEVAGANWLRLHFAAAALGKNSTITLRAKDGGLQVLDAKSLAEWSHSSAFLNGDVVAVELHAAPEDKAVFFRLDRVFAGQCAEAAQKGSPDEPEATCGNDDRVASGDNRVGRIRTTTACSGVWCTAFRVTNGALLTAGFCADPDDDGIVDLTGVVEFNVPASDASGNTMCSNPNDQYPIDTASIVWNFFGNGQSLGRDWAVFRVLPNSNTKLLPNQAYGFPFRMTTTLPATGATLRVTGFGTDTGAQNRTNQTAVGSYYDWGSFCNGACRYVSYSDVDTDTGPGAVGSPLIVDALGIVIGIHNYVACPPSYSDGCSFETDALENAIQVFPGPVVRYVDAGFPGTVAADGTIFRPYYTMIDGVNAVPDAGIVSIVAGSYTLPSGALLTRPMRLEAPAGTVTVLGN